MSDGVLITAMICATVILVTFISTISRTGGKK